MFHFFHQPERVQQESSHVQAELHNTFGPAQMPPRLEPMPPEPTRIDAHQIDMFEHEPVTLPQPIPPREPSTRPPVMRPDTSHPAHGIAPHGHEIQAHHMNENCIQGRRRYHGDNEDCHNNSIHTPPHDGYATPHPLGVVDGADG